MIFKSSDEFAAWCEELQLMKRHEQERLDGKRPYVWKDPDWKRSRGELSPTKPKRRRSNNDDFGPPIHRESNGNRRGFAPGSRPDPYKEGHFGLAS